MKINYSEKALQNLSNCSSKYEINGVKNSWTILLLVSLTIFFIGLFTWSFYGKISESVKGTGIVLLSGGVSKIISFGNGRLEKINFKEGDLIKVNDIFGIVNNPEVQLNYNKINAEYNDLKSEIEILKKGYSDFYANLINLNNERQKHFSIIKQKLEITKGNSQELSDILNQLLKSHSVSKVEYYKTLEQSISSEISIYNLLVQLVDFAQQLKAQDWEKEQKIITLDERLKNKESELNTSKKVLDEMSSLKATNSGILVELLKNENEYVNSGEVIALVADHSKGYYFVGYLPPEDGKKVKEGMVAYFSPVVAPASKYGYIKTVVKKVGTAPINFETVTSELSNLSLAEALTARRSVVRIELEPEIDHSTKSGYAWTSGKGFPGKINNGVPGAVIVEIEYRSPISFVIPAIKEMFEEKVKLYNPQDKSE